jgi:hypothetical protein
MEGECGKVALLGSLMAWAQKLRLEQISPGTSLGDTKRENRFDFNQI